MKLVLFLSFVLMLPFVGCQRDNYRQREKKPSGLSFGKHRLP